MLLVVVRRNMTTQDWTRMLKSFRTKTYRNLPTDEDRASAGSALINTRSNSGGGGGDANSRSKLIPDDSTPPITITTLYSTSFSFLSVAPSLARSLLYTESNFDPLCVIVRLGYSIQRSVRPSVCRTAAPPVYRMDPIGFFLLFSF